MVMIREMAVKNKLAEFIDGLGVTRYEFAKKVGIATNTVYSLCSDDSKIPAPSVMDKIHAVYPNVEPNDLIAFVKD